MLHYSIVLSGCGQKLLFGVHLTWQGYITVLIITRGSNGVSRKLSVGTHFSLEVLPSLPLRSSFGFFVAHSNSSNSTSCGPRFGSWFFSLVPSTVVGSFGAHSNSSNSPSWTLPRLESAAEDPSGLTVIVPAVLQTACDPCTLVFWPS